MKQEDKELLLKDLCARLPYGAKCIVKSDGYVGVISSIESQYGVVTFDDGRQEEICDIKPYLFPLSSMTEEQIEEAKTYFWKDVDYGKSLVDKRINCFYPCFNILEFYHKNHFDYRGLIDKSLALDATVLNIY